MDDVLPIAVILDGQIHNGVNFHSVVSHRRIVPLVVNLDSDVPVLSIILFFHHNRHVEILSVKLLLTVVPSIFNNKLDDRTSIRISEAFSGDCLSKVGLNSEI